MRHALPFVIEKALQGLSLHPDLQNHLKHPGFRYGLTLCDSRSSRDSLELARDILSLRSTLMRAEASGTDRSQMIGEMVCLLHAFSSPYRLMNNSQALPHLIALQTMDYVHPEVQSVPLPFRIQEISHGNLHSMAELLQFEEQTLIQFGKSGMVTANVQESLRLSFVRAIVLIRLFLTEFSEEVERNSQIHGLKTIAICWLMFVTVILVWQRRITVLKD